MATLLFHDIIFGPVQSRRLGVSLGVNLLPAHGKWCNFDCIYCECGWNAEHHNDHRLPTQEQVREALQEKLQRMQQDGALPDAITFSGNGEPTLHPQFPEIIDDVIALRNRFAPLAKTCVLSNATNLCNDAVFYALQKTDKPILKLDSAIESSVRRINQPQGNYSITRITGQMQRFEGKFTLQTLFLRGLFHREKFDNSTPEEVGKWLDIVQLTRPREIMLYTIHRDTPAQTLQKLTKEELLAIAQKVAVINTWGASVQISG
ncbi:MAG: radical SAM protein [Prevotellaceae bacterium]|jgi:wyosine [tRNA(Phe)-imidazoG37] synthetase (radical SAM superfamily)|nr:radical SAM protein [Prevotellaceae bacterium]